MVVDGVSGTGTGTSTASGSGDGPEVDSEEERAVTVGEESEEEVQIQNNVKTMHLFNSLLFFCSRPRKLEVRETWESCPTRYISIVMALP